jgi:hypothetical protein
MQQCGFDDFGRRIKQVTSWDMVHGRNDICPHMGRYVNFVVTALCERVSRVQSLPSQYLPRMYISVEDVLCKLGRFQGVCFVNVLVILHRI